MSELSLEIKVHPVRVLHALLEQAQQDLIAVTACGSPPSLSRCQEHIRALQTCIYAQSTDVQAYLSGIRAAYEEQAPGYSIGQLRDETNGRPAE